MHSVYAPRFFTAGVPPFGHPRFSAYLQLRAAFRSLSRPSSAPNAKASPICSSSLELPSAVFPCFPGSRSQQELLCSILAVLLAKLFLLPFTEKPDSPSGKFPPLPVFMFPFFVCHVCLTCILSNSYDSILSYSVFNERSALTGLDSRSTPSSIFCQSR